jgi:WD40 repeat protein
MVTASPDGRILVASDAGGDLVVYEVTDDLVTETALLDGPQNDGEGTVFALAFSPDGRWLAAGGTSGEVRLIDLADPTSPGEPVDLPTAGTVYALAWPDATTLYAGTQNPGLLRWELEDGGFVPGAAPGTDHAVFALATDGNRLAAGDEVGGVTVWPVDDGDAGPPARATLGALAIASLAFDDGELLVGGRDSLVQRLPLEDAGLGEPVEVAQFDSWVNAMTTSDGYFAAGSSDSTVRVWRSEADTSGRSFSFSAPVTSLQPVEGRRLAVALTNGDLQVVDLARALVYPGPGNVFTTQFALEGERLLVVPGLVNRLAVFDTSVPGEPALLARIAGDEESGFNGVGTISPDGDLVVVARRDGNVIGFDISDPERPQRLFMEKVSDEMPEHMLFAPSGDFFAVGGDDNMVHVVSLSDGEVTGVEDLSGPTNYVLNVGISPDGDEVAAASLDGSVHRWVRDGDTWTAIDPLEVGSAVLTLAFHPDGGLLAASGSDTVVRLWDIRGSEPVLSAELTGPDNEVYQVNFSSTGMLAAASTDQTLTVWEPADEDADAVAYTTYAVLRPGSGALFATGWAPGGAQLAAGGVDGAVHIWDVDPADVRERICATGGDLLSEEEWHQKVGGLAYEPPCSP